jgi:hypothetical protein
VADQDNPPAADKIPTFRTGVEQWVGGLVDADAFAKFGKQATGIGGGIVGAAVSWFFGAVGKLAGKFIRALGKAVELVDPAFGEIAKAGIQALFGVEIPAGDLNKIGSPGAREAMKRDVGAAMMKALTGLAADGGGGSVEPSMKPAEQYLGTIADFAIEGWLMGLLVEVESLGHIKHFGDLKDIISESFGFGRLTRRILGPAITTLISDPMDRAIKNAYRPNLLGAGDVARQVARGRWPHEQGIRELALQGWSDARIDALFNAAAKFHSVADLTLFERKGFWTFDQAVQHLRDQGYEQSVAVDELLVETLKLEEGYSLQTATAAVDAYVAGRLTHGELTAELAASGVHNVHLKPLHDLALQRRLYRQKDLSPAEAEACVKAGVLAIPDYRDALVRDGYTPDAVTAKELLLRWELDKQKSVDQHRAELEAERAAAQALRDKAAQARLAQVEAQRALQRRGSMAELSRAAVRGVIPIARVAEVLSADYDADTVGILVSLVEADRQTYLMQQQKAAAAEQRAATLGLTIGDVKTAVLDGVLTIDQYAQRLARDHVAPADAQVLTETLAAQLADRQRAEAHRRAADLAATNKSIDLGRFEQLVLRGVRTVAQYDALLASLGFGEAARADMDELLSRKIAAAHQAAAIRADAALHPPAHGLTLDQVRRGILLGLAPADTYQTYLVAQGYTADAQQLLVAELAVDVAAADAARAKRDAAGRASDGRTLPVSAVARAARLGLVSPDVYQARLRDAGYTDDDVAIDMALLMTEIADVQAARATRDAAAAPAAPKGLTLTELARAVRLGVQHLEDYRAAAVAAGLTPDAVDTLTRVLAEELQATADAKARRATIHTALAAQNLSLPTLEARVLSGEWTVAQFVDALAQTGYAPADAALLGSLLVDQVDAASTPA